MPDLDLKITDSQSKEHEILDDCDALLYQSPYPPVTLLCNVDDPQEAPRSVKRTNYAPECLPIL